LEVDRDDLIGFLEEEDLTVAPTMHSPQGITIRGLKGSVEHLNTFKKGLFQVQGEAAQICSHLISPKQGESVLDLCAGLGGKSTHLAEIMGGKGRVVSLDINRGKLVRLSKSCRRLGIGCVQPVVADASAGLSSVLRITFDKILLDGPCSGLGILSKHPDGKWSKDETDIQRLGRLQKRILNEAVPLLKKGGTMLYVTCTISKTENEDVVGAFLSNNSGMILENLKDHVPAWGLELIDEKGFFKTLPHVHGMDGFFAALFRKMDIY
jgi:16S rRNA (cytosine967-C5)-methyltransferase